MQTIAPLSPLPAITDPVLIDGESQPGYAGTPLIELSGSQAGIGDGLLITGPGVTVRGLDINDFSQGAGIDLSGAGATGDWVYGNVIGTDPTGTQAEPNLVGVQLNDGAHGDIVGTDANGDGQANRISGNTEGGVDVGGSTTSFAQGFAGASRPAHSQRLGYDLRAANSSSPTAAVARRAAPSSRRRWTSPSSRPSSSSSSPTPRPTASPSRSRARAPRPWVRDGGGLGMAIPRSPASARASPSSSTCMTTPVKATDSTGLYLDGASRPSRRST